MSVRIGFATWTLGDVPLSDYIAALVRFGYEGIELVGDLGRLPMTAVRSIMADHGLPVLSIVPTSEIDLAHPLPSLRQKNIDLVRGQLDSCAALGCDRYVLREKPGRIRPIAGRVKEWTLFQQSLQSIAYHAATMNIEISLLPVNRYEGFLITTHQEALQTLDQVPHLNISIALNTYHMNIEEEDVVAAIERVEGRLGLLYAAESHRRAVGEGHIDWLEICLGLARIGYQSDIIVECQAPGADPFLPLGRASDWPAYVLEWAERSIRHLRVALAATRR